MNVIEVKHVQKKFKIYYDKGRSLKERLLFRNRNYHENRWVLKDISFAVERGEAVGLIGQNGCGKSTMLKLLTKIMYPDSGQITMIGRVASLIELGAGFHPDMSGRENIYTNASIFGLTHKEIETRLQTIVDFSELWDFIDNPVRTYSSGMYMRLAFAVAINVDADILLIDEILAVGDASFQAKCFNRLREIKASGTTIVIVSHSMGQIEQICDRTLWIEQGIIKREGLPRVVHPEYLAFMGEKKNEPQHQLAITKTDKEEADKAKVELADPLKLQQDTNSVKKRWGSQLATISEIFATGTDGKRKTVFYTGESVTFYIQYQIKDPVLHAVFGVGFIRTDGTYCYGTNTMIDRLGVQELSTDGCIQFIVPKLNLLPGNYLLDIAIEEYPGIPLDYYQEAFSINVYSEIEDIGALRLEHEWKLT